MVYNPQNATLVDPPSGPPLTLDPLAGPPVPPIEARAGSPTTLGRSSECQVSLRDEAVSRRHAQLICQNGQWVITDLGSRHGTFVNTVRLGEQSPAPLRAGDLVSIGPWTFRARLGPASALGGFESGGMGHVTTDDGRASHARVERVSDRELAAITQQRLNLLMECAAGIAGVQDEPELAKVILNAAVEGTGFPRAALLRISSPSVATTAGAAAAAAGGPAAVEVILDAPRAAFGPGSFSRSLLAAASNGQMVRLTDDAPMTGAESIMRLGIQTALCAPVMVGSTVTAYLYLDARAGDPGAARSAETPTPRSTRARGGVAGAGVGAAAPPMNSPQAASPTSKPTEGVNRVAMPQRVGAPPPFPPMRGTPASVQHDAAAFCQAVAKMCGLAMGNLSRHELERRQRELVQDLDAAREAQRLIMPPEQGRLAGLSYAMRMRSGRFVAGDLFDVIDLGQGRVAVFLGDVAGKGVSAAILMATTQTYLSAALRDDPDPARAIGRVNQYVCKHAASSRFVTLWLGVFDSGARTVRYVDAGHGHWVITTPEGATRRIDSAGGIPLGIEDSFPYTAETLPLTPGARLVVFSDGVVEQPRPDGEQFGLERALEALRASTSVAADVSVLFDAVFEYAQTDSLADDTTVSSIALE